MSHDESSASEEEKKDPRKIQEELAEFEKELEDELKPIDEKALLGFRSAEPRQEQPEPASPDVEPAAAEPAVAEPEEAEPVAAQSAVEEAGPEEPAASPDVHIGLTTEDEEAGPEESVAPPDVEISLTTEDEEQHLEPAFDAMLQQYLPQSLDLEVGDIIEAPIVTVRRDYVLVDVGDKTESVIDVREFLDENGEINISVGDLVEVLVQGRDEDSGQVIVSHQLAVQRLSLERLQRAWENKTPVSGKVTAVVKGGLIVRAGIPCFMPASQIDCSRVSDLTVWLGKQAEAYVVDFDWSRRRVILSRRKLLEEAEEQRRQNLLASLNPGDNVTVKVKSVLDFGAFVDLGGLDAFMPREEVTWERGAHPSTFLKEGQIIKVRILSVDCEACKVAVSRRQAKVNPWETIDRKYPVGKVVRGTVVNMARYGAFVNLEEGLTGLIHASDLSWTSGVKRPQDYVKEGDTVKAVVLGFDKEKRRLSLGLKHITQDPWIEAEKKYPVGSKVQGVVTAFTNYGAFVRLDETIEGMIHITDLSWGKTPSHPAKVLRLNQEVEAVVLKTDLEGHRISLGLKQCTSSPFEQFARNHSVGDHVKGRIVRLVSFGAFVDLDTVEGLIHISQIAPERIETPDDVLKVGQTVDLKITKIDAENEKISLSRKEYLRDIETREAEAYLNQDIKGGVNIGELLKKLPIEPRPEE
jgi:small subunit ribosomal protein S1